MPEVCARNERRRASTLSASFSTRYANGGLLSEATAKIVSASTGSDPAALRTPKPPAQLTSPSSTSADTRPGTCEAATAAATVSSIFASVTHHLRRRPEPTSLWMHELLGCDGP